MNQASETNGSRPFYLIGHRCNSISKINKAIRQKVNGIECDVWADRKKKWWISHSGFFKTDPVKWLNHIAKAEKKFGRQLSLIVFDIKSSESIIGLRQMINDHLPPDLPRLYSTSSIDKGQIFCQIVSSLHHREVIAIDEEDNPKEVADFFRKMGATQCWYANGITLFFFDNRFHDSMQQAASIRDSTGPFSKIYTWSIHRKKSMCKYIAEDKVDGMIVGLNGILTRPVSKALRIIESHQNIHLANRNSPLF